MIDLNATFNQQSDLEAGILRNVDELVDLGLDRTRVEPIVRTALSHLQTILEDFRTFPAEAGIHGHDATLARVLTLGGLANWMEGRETLCFLALQAYVSKYGSK